VYRYHGMKTAVRALALTTLALWSTSASAKSQTIRIEIAGPGLAQSLEITDRGILRSFNFWNGPGVAVNGQPVHLQKDNLERIGAFIDWPRGPLAGTPSDELRYEVTFHQRATGAHARYVIRYAFDPAKPGGFIYLPGPPDGAVYRDNVFSIVHGVEGNWFHSSPAWERLVRPLIERAADGARVTSPAAVSR
jgi:hypothetical protein